MVIDNIRIWKETIASTRMQENAVYELTTNEREHHGDGHVSYFSSYALAYKSFAETKQHYIEETNLRDTEIYATIKRIYLDEEPNDMDIFYVDNELRLILVRPARKRFGESDECEIADLYDACYVYIPLPFKKGDIIKSQSPFMITEYGVIPSNPDDREHDVCMIHGGDGTDMTIAPDVYLDWRDEFDFMDGTPLLSLRYCSTEELPEKQKMLEKLSQARKGEIDWYSLLMKK